VELSIIVVNWNSVAYLRKSLQSIYDTTAGVDFEILVVDNASFDGCGAVVATEFPNVRFIQSGENVGFARANNIGFLHAHGKNILFLNPDTEVVGSAILELVSNLNSLPDAGAVSARLLNADGSPQVSCIQPFPTILNQIFDLEFLERRFPGWWGLRPLFHDGGAAEVEAVSGACLMVKREIFERVGMFSEDYFMYAEDVDLCYKIKRAGAKVYHIPTAQLLHYGGGSAKEHPMDSLEIVLTRECTFRFFEKVRGKMYAGLYRTSLGLVSLFRLAGIFTLILLARTRLLKTDRQLSNVAKKWSSLLSWSLGGERWTQTLFEKSTSEATGK